MTNPDTQAVLDLCQNNPIRAIQTALDDEAGAAMAALVPPHIRPGIARYLILGIKPGSFLRACFMGDLLGAAVKADQDNAAALASIANWITAFAPSDCYGSDDAIRQWADQGGIGGAA